MRAYVDIVSIVVLSVLAAIDGVGHTSPLSRIACSLQGARQSADLTKALDIAHATTKANGIGSDHTTMTALVGNGDTIELAVSCIEVECAQINPGAATHLLVHTELGALATMPYGIQGIVDAVGQRLITDVDGITSRLLEIGLVGSQTIARLAAGGFYHAGCSCLEWILEVLISPSVPGKTRLTGLLPLAVRCHLDVVTLRAVVVDNDLLLLPVALTRGEHYGS